VAGSPVPWWSWAVPLAAGLLVAAELAGLAEATDPLLLAAAPPLLVAGVFAAVHHAETVQARIGETAGVILLALSVTVIEVALIASVMLRAEAGAPTIARDAVFATVMIVLNGIIGLSLVVGSLRHREQTFQLQGTASALGVLGTLAGTTMVLPDFTVSAPGPTFAPVQLLFVSICALTLYGIYLAVQAGSQRSYFVSPDLPPGGHGPVSGRTALAAAALLLATLAGVVLLADSLAPSLQRVVLGAGLPLEVVGVAIAALVLLPEGTSAVRAARRDRLQSSLNFALGSAIASTGLTIPAVSLLSVVLGIPIDLGLATEHVALLIMSLFIATLTLSTGRTTVLQGAIHLVLFFVFLLIAAVP
jgi:Ca2+:H+ antiporter